jgi:hypothetical protein
MTTPTCMRCGCDKFATATVTPDHSHLPMLFVLCTACGGVVNATYGLQLPATIAVRRRPRGSATRRPSPLSDSVHVLLLSQGDRC